MHEAPDVPASRRGGARLAEACCEGRGPPSAKSGAERCPHVLRDGHRGGATRPRRRRARAREDQGRPSRWWTASRIPGLSSPISRRCGRTARRKSRCSAWRGDAETDAQLLLLSAHLLAVCRCV